MIVAALFATLLPVLVHLPLALGNVVHYALDHAQLQFPRFVILCDALQLHGELPYWQHLLYGGAPFHANPEIPTLYPPALALAAFLPPARTMNVFIVSHMAFGALGMFLFVRHLWRVRLGRGESGAITAATLASVLFLSNFYTRLEHIHLVEYGAAHMLLPWILLATERILLGRAPGLAAAALAALGGLLVNTGGLYVILFGGMFCAAWVVRFGLLNGSAARRRAFVWITPAVIVALLLALAKLLPYFEWLPVTNRADPVPEAIACGRSLGGKVFTFGEFASEIALRTGVGVGVFLFALGAVWHVRTPLVRFLVVVVLVTVFFAAGPAYPWLYHLGAPFDMVRTGPERLWTIVNLVWPIVAGCGVGALVAKLVAWLARRTSPTPTPRDAWIDAALGVGVSLLLLTPLLADRKEWAPTIALLEPVGTSIQRYTRWPEASANAGTEWRVWWIGNEHSTDDGSLTPIGDKNEQFFTTFARVETLAGLLGYLWPKTLEQHLYLGQDGVLDEVGRTRRSGMLSARWLVSSRGQYRPEDQFKQLDPRGVDGKSLIENPWVRPRVMEPRRVVAVFGDVDTTLMYRLLDDISTPVDVAFVFYTAHEEPSAAECALFELVLLVDDTAPPAALGGDVPIVRTAAIPAPDVWQAIGEALGDEEEELRVAGRLERDGPNRTNVTIEPADRDRFVLLSETWSMDPGWHVTVDGQPALLRRADGIVTALHVPAGATKVAAEYAPPSIRRGFIVGAFGLVGVCLLAIVGFARRERTS